MTGNGQFLAYHDLIDFHGNVEFIADGGLMEGVTVETFFFTVGQL